MASNKSNGERAVLVTTSHRGVFFGYATETGGAIIKLRAARKSFKEGAPCPKCTKPLERKPGMFFWRGDYFPGAICIPCNALWPIRGEEMPPLQPVKI